MIILQFLSVSIYLWNLQTDRHTNNTYNYSNRSSRVHTADVKAAARAPTREM